MFEKTIISFILRETRFPDLTTMFSGLFEG